MSRWIDAEYCEDFFDKWESRVKNAEPVTIDVVQNTRTLLRDAPSIDLVRCAECKHKQQCRKAVEHIKHEPGTVTIGYKSVDFCSYGERKESK